MNNQNIKLFRFIIIIIFLINPLISIIFLIIFYINNSYSKLIDKKLFFILISIFLGTINASRAIEGDLGFYYDTFNSVSDNTFVSYFNNYKSSGKEIGYSILNFFGYYISFGSWKLYITFITFLIYMPLYLAIDKYYKSNRSIITVSGVILISFFFQYFSLSIQLLRQHVAVSIMLYSLINFSKGNKKIYFLIFLSILIHSMVLIFPVFLLFKSFYHKFSLKNIKVLFINSLTVLILITLLVIFDLTPDETINQFISKTDIFNINNQVYFTFISIVIILILIHNIIPPKDDNKFFILNICFSLVVISLISKDISPLISYRYFFVIYTFLPFLVPLLFNKHQKFNFIFNSFLIFFMILFFFNSFQNSVWNYAPLEEMIFIPFNAYL